MIQARISKRFPPQPDSAAFPLEIEFEAGAGVTALFGPSGAGKTLTLDAIAGFVQPDAGRILLDDQILFDAASRVSLRPQERHCGYVFQNYALFPHMTIRQNLVFAADRHPRLERHRLVNEMLERFHLDRCFGPAAARSLGRPEAALLDCAGIDRVSSAIVAGRAGARPGCTAPR